MQNNRILESVYKTVKGFTLENEFVQFKERVAYLEIA